jgi:hypothetical protein
VIQNGGDEAVDRLGVGDAVESVVDDAHHNAVVLASPVGRALMDAAQIWKPERSYGRPREIAGTAGGRPSALTRTNPPAPDLANPLSAQA